MRKRSTSLACLLEMVEFDAYKTGTGYCYQNFRQEPHPRKRILIATPYTLETNFHIFHSQLLKLYYYLINVNYHLLLTNIYYLTIID